MKSDDGRDEQHPGTGTSDNPPKADTKPVEPAASAGGAADLLPRTLAAEAVSLLARDLAPTVLDALGTLAARMSEPTLLFDAIFVPSANPLVDVGPVPGRPDMADRWAHDQTSVTFSALVDGEWRTLTGGAPSGNAYLDENGEPVAVSAPGPDGRETLVTSVEVLDRALADRKSGTSEPDAARSGDGDEPKLCPNPAPEPKTAKSQNSIVYQEHVSKLPYGLAINVGGVMFDGCDPATGDLLEAKADIDLLFDDNDRLNVFLRPENDPLPEMRRQVARRPPLPFDNARHHHAKLVREWLAQPDRKIVLHFIPPYCPHLNPIERLWLVMHKHVTHNKTYAKFRDFAEAVLGFLRETVPRRFDEFSSIITDNFRVIEPKDFRILA